MGRYPLLLLWICIAIAALFFIGVGVTAYGFGGDSFGGGKATPTPTPAPAATQTPVPTPPSLPISSSGVIGANNQRCVDRAGYVAGSKNCVAKDTNYRWYYGGTGLNIGDVVKNGSFSSSTPAPAKTETSPTPKPERELPYSMYNDNTVQTCVDDNNKVTNSGLCAALGGVGKWYYYPLRKGIKPFKLGEKVKGGGFDEPADSTPTPTPAAPPTPVVADNELGAEGVAYEFTNLTKNNQVRACVGLNTGQVYRLDLCKQIASTGYQWYYYIPSDGRIIRIGEKPAGGSFDPVSFAARGELASGPEPAVPPSAATPAPAEPRPDLSLAKKNDDKLRPLTPDDIELVGKYAAVAAKPLEEMTPKVWQAAVRHQYALAFSKPIWPLALAGIAFWWVFFIKSRWHIHDGCEDEERWLYLACVYIVPPVVTLVFGTIGLVRLSTSIARLVAPEYYAIMDFVQTLVK